MKIGILTLTLHTNYGGILQAYALQTVLERMGHEVVIFNRPFTCKRTPLKYIIKRLIKKIFVRDVIIFKENRYKREAPIINKAVWDFRKKYIHERIISSLRDIKEGDVDCIIVGSDQVWRPRYFKSQWQTGIEDAFLAFIKGRNIKRIAYAASLGVDKWEYNEDETLKCSELIKLFDAISVREDSGVKLLKKNMNIDAVHVVDPTLLLKVEDYKILFDQALTPKSRGNLLVYMLDIDKDKRNLINKIVAGHGLKPFTVNNIMISQKAPIEERILPSVESWLRGFYDAEMIVTDSFHACVFSIIFGKPFVVVNNPRRGTARIQSLLKSLYLNKHYLEDSNDYNPLEDYSIGEINTDKRGEMLKTSLSYLQDSLKS